MNKKPSKLEISKKKAADAVILTNQKIGELGRYSNLLYTTLKEIQALFDLIRNVPSEDKIKFENYKRITINWKHQVDRIEEDYKKIETMAASQGAAGVGAGVAVVALGPSAAMGVATTFGVASTGTAISALSGAAATNAALAWLGGGALAAGGGGMAAGSAFLTLAGPVGWAIAGISLAASGLMLFISHNEKERLENIYTHISNRDVEDYRLAIVELCERIERIKNENRLLRTAIERIKTFGTDYDKMTEKQQYELGSYVNLMNSATMLLVNPILGLQPKFKESDYYRLCVFEREPNLGYFKNHKDLVIALANLLYDITLDDQDKKVLAKSLDKNKEFKDSMKMSREKIGTYDLSMIERALWFKREYP